MFVGFSHPVHRDLFWQPWGMSNSLCLELPCASFISGSSSSIDSQRLAGRQGQAPPDLLSSPPAVLDFCRKAPASPELNRQLWDACFPVSPRSPLFLNYFHLSLGAKQQSSLEVRKNPHPPPICKIIITDGDQNSGGLSPSVATGWVSAGGRRAAGEQKGCSRLACGWRQDLPAFWAWHRAWYMGSPGRLLSGCLGPHAFARRGSASPSFY